MKEINVVLDFDDLNPSKDWGLDKDNSTFKYINKLQEEFKNLKVTLYVPANFRNLANLKFNQGWVEWLKSKKNIEICAHGVTHYNQSNKKDVKEFYNITPWEMDFKIKECVSIFKSVNIDVKGFRIPGWLSSNDNQLSSILAENGFEYLAEHRLGSDIHYLQNNHGLKLALVPYTYSVDEILPKYYDTIILHGHITQKDGNKNGLNDQIYNNIRNYLTELESKFKVNYLTTYELVKLKR